MISPRRLLSILNERLNSILNVPDMPGHADEVQAHRFAESRAQIRIDGRIVDPRLVVAGEKESSDVSSIEIDIAKLTLTTEFEMTGRDLRGHPLEVRLFKDLKRWGREGCDGYLRFVREPPKRELRILGIVLRPARPIPQWAWVSTSEVRDGDEVITIVGRAVAIDQAES